MENNTTIIKILGEDEMRIILNDELFLDEKYLELTKQDADRLFKIVSLFAKEDKNELSINLIKTNFDLTEEFINKVSFCLKVENSVSIKKYFSWFKGNKSAVAKTRSNVSVNEVEENTEITTENVVVKKNTSTTPKKAVDIVNYAKIKDIFNEIFKDTSVPEIKILNDKRKISIKKLYLDMTKQMDLGVADIYEFYDIYFSMVSEDKNLVAGWPNPQNGGKIFQPDLEYFLKDKCFTRLIEKSTK